MTTQAPQPQEGATSLPIHRPETFGDADTTGAVFHGDVLALAPAAQKGARPAVARIHTGPRANHILFRFQPGQQLRQHKAAHPITVSAPEGALLFTVAGQDPVVLSGGMMMHLDAYIPHEVAVADGADGGVLWLIMHTGD
ncbi:LuxR family transcriptional regulator [Corynebacterium sp. 13CS0277]|uniref:LuxR family transcriptional regulator n=1 Tax=Corynebacterium sp. 13CS0277 TaxID=2071994 RepID=UPI000D03303C|nr:LuxR family transcriptional regulator [Corynebacterium sp. 13CS0277]PRQ12548.1 LuxR family transcriptional regulator [Corynebacterium sp. 13CS0277]